MSVVSGTNLQVLPRVKLFRLVAGLGGFAYKQWQRRRNGVSGVSEYSRRSNLRGCVRLLDCKGVRVLCHSLWPGGSHRLLIAGLDQARAHPSRWWDYEYEVSLPATVHQLQCNCLTDHKSPYDTWLGSTYIRTHTHVQYGTPVLRRDVGA